MNELLSFRRELSPTFTRLDIVKAFETAAKQDSSFDTHLYTAMKYNCTDKVQDMLDYACACDFLLIYKGEYIAIDWTEDESKVTSKVEKHKWLKPVYDYLGIDYTLVVNAKGYLRIRNKEQALIARLSSINIIERKLDNMMVNNKQNSSLEFVIKTKF